MAYNSDNFKEDWYRFIDSRPILRYITIKWTVGPDYMILFDLHVNETYEHIGKNTSIYNRVMECIREFCRNHNIGCILYFDTPPAKCAYICTTPKALNDRVHHKFDTTYTGEVYSYFDLDGLDDTTKEVIGSL